MPQPPRVMPSVLGTKSRGVISHSIYGSDSYVLQALFDRFFRIVALYILTVHDYDGAGAIPCGGSE